MSILHDSIAGCVTAAIILTTALFILARIFINGAL